MHGELSFRRIASQSDNADFGGDAMRRIANGAEGSRRLNH